MFLLLSLSAAFADVTDVAAPEMCMAATPSQTFPGNGATNVPLDVVPAVVFTDNGCGNSEWVLTLTRDEDGEVAGTVNDAAPDFLAELALDADLDADTAYTLTISGTQEAIVTFTTGAALVQPHGLVPEVLDVSATWEDVTQQVVFSGNVLNGASAGQDLIVQWQTAAPGGGDELKNTFVDAAGTQAEHVYVAAGSIDAPSDWCLTPSIRKDDGTWNVGEEVCGEVDDQSSDDPFSCSTGGGSSSAFAALLASASLLARRARRA